MEQTPLQIVSEILLQAREDIAMVLTDTTHQNILLSVTSNLTRLANQTAHLGGITIKQVTPVDFPPVTNFMGEPIIRPKEIKEADLEPEKSEVEILQAKIQKLYDSWDSLAHEGILNAYTLPEEQLVIRGVAKWAGVPNYEDATLNLHFLEKITRAMKQSKQEKKTIAGIEEQLQKQEEIVKLQSRITDVDKKIVDLNTDLAEASEELAQATTDAAKKKGTNKVSGLKDEITAAHNLKQELIDRLKELVG
jgi:hypothetical protein